MRRPRFLVALYLWSLDLRWVTFQTRDGLWAVSPDGTTEHLLQEGDRSRQLAGWWDGNLVFVDYGTGDGTAAISVARPGEQSRIITQLKGTVRNLELATAVSDPHLGIWDGSTRSLQIDLRTGERKEMDTGPVPSRCVPPLGSGSTDGGAFGTSVDVRPWPQGGASEAAGVAETPGRSLVVAGRKTTSRHGRGQTAVRQPLPGRR